MENKDFETNKELKSKIWSLLKDPSEDDIYKSYFKNELWSVNEFAALISELTPENFSYFKEHPLESSKSKDHKNVVLGIKIIKDLIDTFEYSPDEKPESINENSFFTKYRFLKWAAMHEIRVRQRFLDCLDLQSIEIFLDHMEHNYILLTSHRESTKFHREYYLKHAQKILERSKVQLSHSDIVKDPHMIAIKRRIKEKYNGEYTPRVIKEKWLRKILKLPRGRPKKNTPQEKNVTL